MLTITPICKRFNKLAGHFKAQYADKSLFGYETVKHTKNVTIADELIPDFLIWLSNGAKGCKQIRTILANQGIEATLEFVSEYEKC